MIDTYINLIVNLEYGWDKYFLNYIVPLKKKYPEEFPYILITFSNHPHWIRDNYSKTDLFDKKFINQMYIKGGVVYPKNSSNVPIDAVIGTTMLTFKRKKIELQLRDFHQNYDSSEVCLLNPILIDYIISLLLKYINLKYGKTSNSTNKKCRVI